MLFPNQIWKILLVALTISFMGAGCRSEKKQESIFTECKNEQQCAQLALELTTAKEQRTLAVQKGDVAEAWRLSLLVATKESLRIKASNAELTPEDFIASEDELALRHATTEAPPIDDNDLTNCLDSSCPVYKHLTNLRLSLADATHTSDDILVLESNLEINYRRNSLARAEDQARKDLDTRYIEVRKLLSSLKSDLGRSASVLQLIGDCPSSTKVECENLETHLKELRRQYAEAVEAGEEGDASAILSDIHLHVALLDLARDGIADTSPEAAAIKRRYGLILALLGRNGTEPGNGGKPTSNERKPYSESERREVDRVMKTFGPLYISASKLNDQGKPIFSEVIAKQHLPWAGYWYPMRDGRLYSENDSPLAKFDAMAKALGRDSRTREIQQTKHDSLAISWSLWDGHCDAWANAAIISPEPKRPVTKNGQTFLVSDIKALLVLKYASYPVDVYGTLYRGTHETDGDIQDIRPEAFQRLVEHFIGEKGLAIGLDDDPEPAIWSKPMNSMRWRVLPDPENKNAFLVQAFPMLINNRNEPSEELTDPNAFDRNDIKRPKWEYRLFYDPSDIKDGKFRVIYGEWINASRINHPDIVFVPKADATPNPRNEEIAKHLDLIDEIVSESLR